MEDRASGGRGVEGMGLGQSDIHRMRLLTHFDF